MIISRWAPPTECPQRMLARPVVLPISIRDMPVSPLYNAFLYQKRAHLLHFHTIAHCTKIHRGWHQDRSPKSSSFTLTPNSPSDPGSPFSRTASLRPSAPPHRIGPSHRPSTMNYQPPRFFQLSNLELFNLPSPSKSFGINTYKSVTKQSTYSAPNPFRINTYKKTGGGVRLWLTSLHCAPAAIAPASFQPRRRHAAPAGVLCSAHSRRHS